MIKKPYIGQRVRIFGGYRPENFWGTPYYQGIVVDPSDHESCIGVYLRGSGGATAYLEPGRLTSGGDPLTAYEESVVEEAIAGQED